MNTSHDDTPEISEVTEYVTPKIANENATDVAGLGEIHVSTTDERRNIEKTPPPSPPTLPQTTPRSVERTIDGFKRRPPAVQQKPKKDKKAEKTHDRDIQAAMRIMQFNVTSGTGENIVGLAKIMKEMNILIMCLQELKRKKAEGEEVWRDYRLWCTDPYTENGTAEAGVGFLVHKDVQVLDFVVHKTRQGPFWNFSRIAHIDIATAEKGTRRVYTAYAPHSGKCKDDIDAFWETLHLAPLISSAIVGLDANAHVHPEDWDYVPNHTAPVPHAVGETTPTGKLLLNFCRIRRLRPANMMITEKNWDARLTFKGHGNAKGSVIDYILMPIDRSNEMREGAKAVTLTERAQVKSDHRPLVVTWRLAFHTAKPHGGKRAPPPPPEVLNPNPAEIAYAALLTGARLLGECHNAPLHQVGYKNWVAVGSRIEQLKSSCARLKRSHAPKEMYQEACKRLKEETHSTRSQYKTSVWTKVVSAFERHDSKSARARHVGQPFAGALRQRR